MNRRPILTVLLSLLFAVTLAQGAFAQNDSAYTEYTARPEKQEFLQIAYNDEVIQFRVLTETGAVTYDYLIKDIVKEAGGVRVSDGVAFDRNEFTVGEYTFAYSEIIDVRMLDEGDKSVIALYSTTDSSSRTQRIRRGNIISPFDNVTIEAGDFVRGLIFSVGGAIEVYGEVNKDIVSLFGDVYLAPEATARGDIASISGDVDVAGDASVYGDIFAGDERRRGRGRRFWREERGFEAIVDADYNRVDGLALLGGASYKDADSLLPSAEAKFGYAFESERTRWNVGIEQVLWRKVPVAIGGSWYRRLANEDEWIITKEENIAFTLLVAEDYRDYYEAEGGRVFVRARPLKNLSLQAEYGYEETRWFDAERDLWSLFGWDKKFPRNYRRLDPAFRQRGIDEIDTSNNGFMLFNVGFDQRDLDHPYDLSAWAIDGMLEWSAPNLGGDFDYRRYRLMVRRYQKLHRRAMVIGRLVYGNSDGYVPMHKRFYLGGLGTLRGYNHKEFVGTRFWMLNGEYRFRFPHSDIAASMLYDVAQIANDTKLNGDVEVKHSLGVALYVGDDFRLSVAKRLDRSGDDTIQLFARVAHTF
jgi:hypothetical protein